MNKIMDKNEIKKLEEEARKIRSILIDMCAQKEGGHHLGGGLSMIEVMTYLYGWKMNIQPEKIKNHDRDVFILSKGHGVLGFYPVLYNYGYIKKETLETYKMNDSYLIAHPIRKLEWGIESSNGSLGHGLSYATGIAYAKRLKGDKNNVYVLIGDGECNEGSIWESIMSATTNKLDNLYCIVDCNKFQSDGETDMIVNQDNLSERFRAFGFETFEVDGHSFESINHSFESKIDNKRPTAIIANTVKGKGIKRMENDNSWHHAAITESIYKEIKEELK